MIKINDFINEKLKVNTKNVKTHTTKIPDQISRKDREEFDRLWEKVAEYAHIWDLYEDDDLDDAVKYYKEIADPKYFNKELIWAYICIDRGYDYMLDDSDDEKWNAGYLSDDWDDVDPIEEFVYRVIADTTR